MPCTGKTGTWKITYTFSGGVRDPATYTGTEDDNPYFSNEGGRAILRSACDGRNMEPPYFASSFNSVSIVNSVFTPDQAPAEKYDCINGACIKASQHNTFGLYQSLSDCEIACGTGCSGKCISNSEWAQIEGLSNQLRNRNCN